MIDVITEHRGCFGIKPICTVLGVGRATYYRWQSVQRVDVVVEEYSFPIE